MIEPDDVACAVKLAHAVPHRDVHVQLTVEERRAEEHVVVATLPWLPMPGGLEFCRRGKVDGARRRAPRASRERPPVLAGVDLHGCDLQRGCHLQQHESLAL
eukprot:4674369-Prymnesium_polylepis.1